MNQWPGDYHLPASGSLDWYYPISYRSIYVVLMCPRGENWINITILETYLNYCRFDDNPNSQGYIYGYALGI